MTLSTPMKDALLGAVFVVIALALHFHLDVYPAKAANFPRLIALAIFAPFGALLIVRAAIQWRTSAAEPAADHEEEDAGDMAVRFDAKTLVMSAAIVFAFLSVGFLGFIEAMAFLSIVSCIVFRIRPLNAAIFTLGFCAVLVGFLYGMDIRLPAGPLSGWIFG